MKAVAYTAAGGVVVAGDRVLVLLRPSRGEIRLPKGKIEPGDTAEATALREVAEESGYADLEIVADLGTDVSEFDHIDADGSPMHVTRTERYFLMRLTGTTKSEQPVEDAEQFITDLKTPDDALASLTYEPERRWLERALAAAGSTT